MSVSWVSVQVLAVVSVALSVGVRGSVVSMVAVGDRSRCIGGACWRCNTSLTYSITVMCHSNVVTMRYDVL